MLDETARLRLRYEALRMAEKLDPYHETARMVCCHSSRPRLHALIGHSVPPISGSLWRPLVHLARSGGPIGGV